MAAKSRFACLVGVWLAAAATAGAQPPPLVGRVDFDELSAGTGVDSHRYRSQGIVLGCTPGHYLYAVERDGPAGPHGRSLAISTGGDEPLWISVTFLVPGTRSPGAVECTDIQALDTGGLGYAWAYFDVRGGAARSGTNAGDSRLGEGWYDADGPMAHRFVYTIGAGAGRYLDDIRFSAITGGPLPVAGATWTRVKAFYRD